MCIFAVFRLVVDQLGEIVAVEAIDPVFFDRPAVIEAGASPLEPYNGDTVVSEIGDAVAFTVLCASDPYAVVGILNAWERRVDLVTGPASNTLAGVALVNLRRA